MAFTKIAAAGIGSTETVTLHSLEVLNNATVGGVLTYEDVTNVDSIGIVTARSGVLVGSGITLSKDGDVFFTGIATGNGSGLTALNASNISSGTVPTARLGSGTASSSTFLRGDSTFATVTSTTINNNANNLVITGSGTANTLEAEANLTFTGSILTVTNNSGASEITLVTPNNTDSGVYFNDGTNKGAVTYQHSDDSMRFRVNATEKLRIDSSGRVGILDSDPQVVLHVQGLSGAVSPSDYSVLDLAIEDNAEAALGIIGNSYSSIYFGDAATVLNAGFVYNHSDNALQIRGSGNVERLRIDSSGRLLLGSGAAATPKASGPGGLDVSQYAISICMGGSSGDSGQARANSTNKEARLVIPHYTNAEEPVVAIAAFPSSGSNQLNFGGGTSLGNAATEINFHTASNTTTTGNSQKWQIASDGDFIGNSPAVIHSGSSAGYLELYGGATNHGGKIRMYGGNGDSSVRFYSEGGTSSPSERLRITGGRLDIGDSLGTAHCGKFQVIHEGGGQLANDCLTYFETNSNDWLMILNSNEGGNASHYHMYFMEEGTVRGQIAGSHGSNVNFSQGSDYRWKENIVDMTGTEGIDICKKLKPRKYNWIKNREGTGQINTVDGFIAHEVQEAGVLGAVTGEKDAVNEDGSIDGQTLDYGQMTPVLAAAIKGLIDKVETLEAEVAALKSS